MGWAALVTVAAVGWLLISERNGSAGRYLAKPIASAGFVAVAAVGGAADSGFGRWMLAGLVLSAVGDVLLLAPSTRWFVGGLGSFLAAHLVFSVAFVVRGVAAEALLAIAGFGLLAWRVVGWLQPHLPDQLRTPVIAYVGAISVMGTLAVATVADDWDGRIALGAGLFIASDLAVARNRLVEPAYANRLVGLPLYYGGQLLLAWAAAAG